MQFLMNSIHAKKPVLGRDTMVPNSRPWGESEKGQKGRKAQSPTGKWQKAKLKQLPNGSQRKWSRTRTGLPSQKTQLIKYKA